MINVLPAIIVIVFSILFSALILLGVRSIKKEMTGIGADLKGINETLKNADAIIEKANEVLKR